MSTYFEIKDAINERLKRAGLSVDVCPVVPGPIQNEGYYYEIHGSSYVYAYTCLLYTSVGRRLAQAAQRIFLDVIAQGLQIVDVLQGACLLYTSRCV